MDSAPLAPRPSGWGLSADDLAVLNEEVAALAKAGLPLDQGLANLAKEMSRGKLKRVTEALADDLARGIPLADALDRRSGQIPAYYGKLVAAGVRVGKVDEVLAALTAYGKSLAEIRWAVLGAVLYPAVVFAFALGVLTLLFAWIVPQFEEIFSNFRVRLPLVTTIALGIANHWVWIVLVPLGTFVVAVVALRGALRRTAAGRARWASFVYSIPLLGTLLRKARLASFVDLLSILIRREAPLPEAFALAGAAAIDPVLANGCPQVQQDLEQGKPLGASLQARRLVPDSVAWMIGSGERRNNLADTLSLIGEMCRSSVRLRTRLMTIVLPPALVLIVAAFVALFFAFGLAMPMFALMEGLSR